MSVGSTTTSPRSSAAAASSSTARTYCRPHADHIRYEVDGGIATITIDRPEKKGAMTYAMLGDFIATVHEAVGDDAAGA